MRMLRPLLISVAAVVLVSATIVHLPPLLITHKGAEPGLGVETSVEVGETMYAEYNELLQSAIVIDEDYKAQKYRFPAGSILYGYKARKGRSTYWCSPDVQIRQFGMNEGPFCFIDVGGEGKIDKRNTAGTIKRSVPSPKYHESNLPVSSKLEEDLPRDIFRFEVVYQGVGAGTLRLLYREYKGDLVRPAFSQDLTFALQKAGPTLVAVKGSRIEVLEAGNLGIRYSVLRGFEE